MKKAHHRLRRLCAVLIGLTFLFSGLFKLLDPVGTGLIVSEYFKFFHVGFLHGLSKPLGMGLALLESIPGLPEAEALRKQCQDQLTYAKGVEALQRGDYAEALAALDGAADAADAVPHVVTKAEANNRLHRSRLFATFTACSPHGSRLF